MLVLNSNKTNSTITLDALETRPDPKPLGPRHVPVRYDEVVHTIHKLIPEVTKQNITNQELVLARKEGVLIGLWEIGDKFNGDLSTTRTLQLGGIFSETELRTAQLNLGALISICTNLMVMGGEAILKHRHTAGLKLEERLREGLTTVFGQGNQLEASISKMVETPLQQQEANNLIIDLVKTDIVPSSKTKEVITNYYEPDEQWEDSKGETLWALHNSVTRAFRPLPPTSKLSRTQKLGQFFGQLLD